MSMQERIEGKLQMAFSPTQLTVINESHLHAGHAGDDGSGESHFRLEIESDSFNGVSRVMRERMVFDALKDEMAQIHALSMTVKPTE
ncbi:MAG: BolA family transcriptional regulator [Alphaproteobacteria bacterium]|nr:BolA family transcriptional regulator [Alphaproteobacteria bacterium]